MAVVGIMGILAAVAIPAYNRYRSNAARGAFDATGSNIARAFNACMTVNSFANCDSLSKIGVAVSYDNNENNTAPFYCVDIETEIGGTTFKGCYSMNAQTGGVTATFNQNICYTDAATTAMHNGTACGTGTGFTTASVQGTLDPCDVQAAPLTLCTASADCTGAGTGDLCGAAQTATCAAAGTCS